MPRTARSQPDAPLARLTAGVRAYVRGAPLRAAALLLLLTLLVYAAYLSVRVIVAFEGRRWDIPAHVYAAPLELYAGAPISADELGWSLRQAGYQQVAVLARPGEYRAGGDRVLLWTRDFRHWDTKEASQRVVVTFAGGSVAGLHTAAGEPLPLLRLEPVRLGSLFAAHHEDRMLVAPDEVPSLLVDSLKTIEDRRYDEHHGLDFAAIARAALVNLRHGEIRQGGSTLTQQLVKSYFLDSRRTFRRKFREAIMAVTLELRYDKDELLNAYVNEVYLGQQGARAIHGFGLASEFYFSRRLTQLDLHEIALLVALVNGPSHYDPRRHPARARERRDWVLATLAEEGVIDEDQAARAAERELSLSDGTRMLSRYQPAYMDLVRRQLARDYSFDELATRGLRVFTSLDPRVQSLAERQLAAGVAELQLRLGESAAPLEGAVVVTRYQTGEVIAMVGSRDPEFDGFNRALAAKRPAGSLVKPAVYLAALQTGEYTLASELLDERVEITLPNGDVWAPANFSEESHGPVPLVRALAESYNQATVRLGMDVGIDRVAELLHDLGLDARPAPLPSLLLGAVETTPFEIATVYGSLASGGFRTPLRAVRAVIDEQGEPLERYPLELEPVAAAAAVAQVNAALVQVIERGTGRSARAMLPAGLAAAGKTGTSGEFRDSWFAGYTGEHLAVVWVGRDDNTPTGLSGAAGALPIWSRLVAGLGEGSGFAPAMPAGLEAAWLDYVTGHSTYRGCGASVLLPLPADAKPPRLDGCGRGLRELGGKALEWLDRINDR